MKFIRRSVIALATLGVGFCVLHFLLTGSPFPIRIVERLNNPRQVAAVTAAGFVMADGTLVKVRHVAEIPTNSAVVNAAVQNGIEVDDQGRTTGLIRLWHTCGNDPVRYHLARVDLSGLILSAGGKPVPEVPEWLLDGTCRARKLRYGPYGLSTSDLHQIQDAVTIIDEVMAAQPPGDAAKTPPGEYR